MRWWASCCVVNCDIGLTNWLVCARQHCPFELVLVAFEGLSNIPSTFSFFFRWQARNIQERNDFLRCLYRLCVHYAPQQQRPRFENVPKTLLEDDGRALLLEKVVADEVDDYQVSALAGTSFWPFLKLIPLEGSIKWGYSDKLVLQYVQRCEWGFSGQQNHTKVVSWFVPPQWRMEAWASWLSKWTQKWLWIVKQHGRHGRKEDVRWMPHLSHSFTIHNV